MEQFIVLLGGIGLGAVGTAIALVKRPSNSKSSTSIDYGYVIDTSALIDGRVQNLFDHNYLRGSILIPSNVFVELDDHVRDTSDVQRAQDARAAVEWLSAQTLEHSNAYDEADADEQVIALAIEHGYDIVTLDQALAENAMKKNVVALNPDQLLVSMLPVRKQGDVLEVKLSYSAGKYAVGVTEFGELIHVKGAKDRVGKIESVILKHISFLGHRRRLEAELSKAPKNLL